MDMNTQNEQAMNKDYSFSPEPSNNPKMRSREAARYLGIGYSTLKVWRAQGIGPSYEQLGERKIFYYKSDLDEFMRKRRHPEQPSIYAGNSLAGLEGDIE